MSIGKNSKEKLAETVFDSLGAMMAAYAEEAIRTARADHRRQLDWSESSIETLENILSTQAASDIEFQTRIWGSYFGEVLRHRFGGEWEMTVYPQGAHIGGGAAVPTLMIGGSWLYPLMKVYRRLTIGGEESLSSFYELIAGRLQRPAQA